METLQALDLNSPWRGMKEAKGDALKRKLDKTKFKKSCGLATRFNLKMSH